MTSGLRANLEAKRREMIETGIRLGLRHPDVVRLSQELDKIHNEILENERNQIREAAGQ